MKIAITGGSGFLGRYLIDTFLADGAQVAALSRSPDRQRSRDGLTWIGGDLQNASSLQELVGDADAVVHAALDRAGDHFMDPPADAVDYFDRNVLGAVRLFEASITAGVGRLIFISSGAVHQHVVDGLRLDENHPLRPGSLYGAAKASVETMVHAYGFSDRLLTATLRPPSIYGAADRVEDSKWFQLVSDVAAGKKVQAAGGGKCVHAADLATAVRLLVHENGDRIRGRTFNCCDRFISEHEVATIAKEYSGSDAVIDGPAKSAGQPMLADALRELGMTFGGTERLRQTVDEMLARRS